MRHVVVTGLGAVTPLGVGVRQSWKRLVGGDCGIVNIENRHERFQTLPARIAGVVPQASRDNGNRGFGDWLRQNGDRGLAKFSNYGLAAAQEALEDAKWKPEAESDKQATGVCLGAGIGNLEEMFDTSIAYNEGGYKKIHPLFVPRLLINLGAGHISMKYGFKGPNHAVSTACTTGLHSIGDALNFIRTGAADVMVAGGAESCIHPLAVGGFARSRSLATNFNDQPHHASRPWDQKREGFVIGEGAGVVVLEELEHALRRGAPRIYASILGYGVSADAHHPVAPAPDGAGALNAMRQALRQSSCTPSSVDYINAHATSTPLGDAAESAAIKSLMVDEGGMTEQSVNVSSTKGAIGHLLGAAGAVEAIFTILAVKEDVLPPTLNLQSPSASLPRFNYVPKLTQRHHVRFALTNSFGFGGTNGCLAFGKFDAHRLSFQSPSTKKVKSDSSMIGRPVPSPMPPLGTRRRRALKLPAPKTASSTRVSSLTSSSDGLPFPPLSIQKIVSTSSPVVRERKSGRIAGSWKRLWRRRIKAREATAGKVVEKQAKKDNKETLDKSQYHKAFSSWIRTPWGPQAKPLKPSTDGQTSNKLKDLDPPPNSTSTPTPNPDPPPSSATISAQQTFLTLPSPPSSTPIKSWSSSSFSSSSSDPNPIPQPPKQPTEKPPTKPGPLSSRLTATRKRSMRRRIRAGLPAIYSPRKAAKLERKAKKAEKKEARARRRAQREEDERTASAPT